MKCSYHLLKFICAVALCLSLAGCAAGPLAEGTAAMWSRAEETAATVSLTEGTASAGSLTEETASAESRAEETADAGTPISATSENITLQTPLAASGAGTASSDALPSRYDLRDQGRTAPVRDQLELNTCWAFASLSALESRLLPEESWDFSEDNMSHDPYFLLDLSDGGEYIMAMAYLLSWRGPVTEAEDPYGDQVSPAGLSPAKHVQEILLLPDGDSNAIKRAVMEWGAVETSIYMQPQFMNVRSDFYNPDTAAYCCSVPMTPNHDTIIVGWDDDFPKEAFTQQPGQNGAYICENNWGTTFGENGFFYVSYEDLTIGFDNVVYSGVEPVSNYSAIFQCDACGWTGQLGYGEESAWAANVYTAGSGTSLAAAGFYTTDKDTEYEVYVARDLPAQVSDDDLKNREKVAEGRLTYSGYYTVPFDKEVALDEGERFAVIIRLTTPGAVEPIAIEHDAGDGLCMVVLDGESYASLGGEIWENTQTSLQCDICLKAYAR